MWWQPLSVTEWPIPSISMIGNHPAEPADRLDWEIRAVAERLRALSAARLRAPLPPYPSREQAGRMLAQRLADAAAAVSAGGSDAPPVWREMPEIDVFAVGEQVAVAGYDLVHALADRPAGAQMTMIWTRSGRRALAGVIEELLATLRELRLTL